MPAGDPFTHEIAFAAPPDEAMRVTAQLFQLARQQMAFARVGGNQLVQGLGVSLGACSD